MTITEFIEKLNRYCAENEVYSVEDFSYNDELDDELEALGFSEVATVDTDEHRWYVRALNVYSVTIDGVKYFVGVWEVETLKSECMSVSDCGNDLEFFEMEEYTTVSYRPKEELNA